VHDLKNFFCYFPRFYKEDNKMWKSKKSTHPTTQLRTK
jgi:hypothetical protein